MSFTGKAIDQNGQLPDGAEDVSDIVGLVSPFETPLLYHLGDAKRPAFDNEHKWVDKCQLYSSDWVKLHRPVDAASAQEFGVRHLNRFEIGDMLQIEGYREIMKVTDLNYQEGTLFVDRRAFGTPPGRVDDGVRINILGNLLHPSPGNPRFLREFNRVNYRELFAAEVFASSKHCQPGHSIDNEIDYQKQEKVRELLRELENWVINGIGSSGRFSTMHGIVDSIGTNVFFAGYDGFPFEDKPKGQVLHQKHLSAAMERIAEYGQFGVDTILVGGSPKVGQGKCQLVDGFIDIRNRFSNEFGDFDVVKSRWVPSDAVILLDSSRIEVKPIQGKSFYCHLAMWSDNQRKMELMGEYTLEFREEMAHGIIRGLKSA